MFDHSYFNYGQMALLRVEVHGAIWSFFIKPQMGITRKPFKQEVEPKFKEAAFGFRHRNLSTVYPHQNKLEKDSQQTCTFMTTTEATDKGYGESTDLGEERRRQSDRRAS